MGLRISRMGVDMNLYARDDLRYFGRHNVDVGPVASSGRPALKELWVNGQQVVADDVLRGVDVGELRSEARGAVQRLMAGWMWVAATSCTTFAPGTATPPPAKPTTKSTSVSMWSVLCRQL